MKNLHLFGEIFLQPLILLDIVIDELDSLFSCYLNSTFTLAFSIEPCLSPPNNTILVWIDTNRSLYIETLDINIKVLKWVYDTLTF